MKIKLLDLWSARFAFIKIFNFQFDDAKLSYILSRIAKKINSEIEDIDIQRMNIAQKHAEKDEKGQPKVKDAQFIIADLNKFNEEFADFLKTEVELDIWQIPFSAIKIVKPTPNEMILLELFVKDLPTEEELKEVLETKELKE